MFKLSDLTAYDNIVIQCHDNPDADALASAFAVHKFLRRYGKEPKIIYSGRNKIKKPNLKFMTEWLEIPVEHVQEIEKPDLLVCVDCQYGEGNVTRIESDNVAVIDHHLQVRDYDMGVIESSLGSCATLVWDLLNKEGFNFAENTDTATALYYGLFTDTNNLMEISHPLDKDIRDYLQPFVDNKLIGVLRNCNLTLDELEIAGVALLRSYNDKNKRYAIFKSEPCDPNILGFIADIGLQVNTVDVCIVYSIHEDGAKLSVRSCSKEVMASEYSEYLTEGVGSGGGHREKAGGYIKKKEVENLGLTIEEYISEKADIYFESYDVYNAAAHDIDVTDMKRYRKKPIPKGFVVSTDIFDKDTPVMIRTLEGDSNIKASPDIYLMIGIQGEVYPIKAEKFHLYYKLSDEKINTDFFEYEPTVKNEITGEMKKLIPFMNACVSESEATIYTKQLERNTKVFTSWNPNGYMYGSPGDYLAIKCDDINDVYIIDEKIFPQTYEECED